MGLTRFQKSIIFRSKCIAKFSYIKWHVHKTICWTEDHIFEYVILDTEGYEHPAYLDTYRVLIDDYWLPLQRTDFDMLFIDIAIWRDNQIDSILEDNL
jgi:hypothetical protein